MVSLKIRYRPASQLVILALHGVQLNIDPKCHGVSGPVRSGRHHRPFGEFFYCGLALDGQLILPEAVMNRLFAVVPIGIREAGRGELYFRPLSQANLRKLVRLELFARCLGDLECASDTEENFNFYWLASLRDPHGRTPSRAKFLASLASRPVAVE